MKEEKTRSRRSASSNPWNTFCESVRREYTYFGKNVPTAKELSVLWNNLDPDGKKYFEDLSKSSSKKITDEDRCDLDTILESGEWFDGTEGTDAHVSKSPEEVGWRNFQTDFTEETRKWSSKEPTLHEMRTVWGGLSSEAKTFYANLENV